MIFKKKESTPNFECQHIYDRYVTMDDPKRMCTDVFMKCSLCNDTIKISTTGSLGMLFKYGREVKL